MIKVLLADSHQLLHLGIRTALSTTNEITLIATATCDSQLRQLCRRHQPDVVLLALNITDQPCSDAVSSIQRQCSTTKILILLHSPDEICLQQFMVSGVNGAILKSDAPEKLIEAIRNVAARLTWFSPSLMSQLLQSRKSKENQKLTEREVAVLQLIATEKTDKEIANTLNIKESTVRYHLGQINIRLGTTTRVGAVVEAIRQGFVQ